MTTIATFIDSIARRVRDANSTAHTRAFVRDIFTRSASVINSRQEYIIDSVTLTGTAAKALYTVETELGGVSMVTDVQVNGNSLDQVDPWRNLWKLSPTWLTDTAAIPLAWAAIGRDRLAIYPAPISDVPITVYGVRGSFQASDEDEETGLDLENDDIVRELTVTLLLLRQRDLDMVEIMAGRVVGKMNAQMDRFEERLRLG